MSVRCKLRLSYGSEEEARRILSSVETDNLGYVTSRLVGSTIISEIVADNIMSLVHTLDDYMSCLAVAEQVIEKNPL